MNLARKIVRLGEEVEAYAGRPTTAQSEWVGMFERQLGDTLGALRQVFTNDVSRLNERLAAAGVPQVVVDRGQDDRSRR